MGFIRFICNKLIGNFKLLILNKRTKKFPQAKQYREQLNEMLFYLAFIYIVRNNSASEGLVSPLTLWLHLSQPFMYFQFIVIRWRTAQLSTSVLIFISIYHQLWRIISKCMCHYWAIAKIVFKYLFWKKSIFLLYCPI